MNKFSHHDLFLTTLSPIHIGSGLDYEPTQFIFDDHSSSLPVLYVFDPAQAKLAPEQSQQLLQACQNGSNQSVYNCFKRLQDAFIAASRKIIPCEPHAAKRFLVKALDNIDVKFSSKGKIYIQRTQFEDTPQRYAPYIPGSSLKGVIHTALFQRHLRAAVHGGLPQELDHQLLNGTMNASPMSLLSVADMRAQGNVMTAISRANRYYKQVDKVAEFPQFFESISLGQYRAMHGSVNIAEPSGLPNTPDPEYCYKSAQEIIADLNAYYRPILDKEITLFNRIASTRAWTQEFEKLRRALNDKIQANELAIIRIGKNSGAESLVLQGKGVAKIQVRTSRTQKQEMDHTTTFNASEEGFNHQRAAIPFGWAVLELDPKSENSVLSAWCEAVKAKSYLSEICLSDLYEALAKKKEQVHRKHLEVLQEVKNRRIKAEQEARQEQLRQEKLATMSENLQALEQLASRLESAADAKPGTDLNTQTFELVSRAQTWPKPEQKQTAARIRPFMKSKKLNEGKRGKELKKLLSELES